MIVIWLYLTSSHPPFHSPYVDPLPPFPSLPFLFVNSLPRPLFDTAPLLYLLFLHLIVLSLSLPPSLPISLPHSLIFSLKAQQGLLVDFAAFPQKFIDLLELCLSEAGKERPKYVYTLSASLD